MNLFLYASPTTSILGISNDCICAVYRAAGQQVGDAKDSGVADVVSLAAGFYIVRSSEAAVLRFTKR